MLDIFRPKERARQQQAFIDKALNRQAEILRPFVENLSELQAALDGLHEATRYQRTGVPDESIQLTLFEKVGE